jgi:hypothetical protein
MYVHVENTCYHAYECKNLLNGAQGLSEVEPQMFVVTALTGNEGNDVL